MLVCIFARGWETNSGRLQWPQKVPESKSDLQIKDEGCKWWRVAVVGVRSPGVVLVPPIPPHSLLNRQWLAKLYKISLRRSLTPSDVANDQSGCITPAAREGGWRCVPESLSNKAEERHSAMQQQTLHSPGAEGCSRWCSLLVAGVFQTPSGSRLRDTDSIWRDLKHSQEEPQGVYKNMPVQFSAELWWRIIQHRLVPPARALLQALALDPWFTEDIKFRMMKKHRCNLLCESVPDNKSVWLINGGRSQDPRQINSRNHIELLSRERL